MFINGFQKLTLLDYPGKVACTVFFAGCNFRCPFCHNASLVLDPEQTEQIPADEILTYLKKRTGVIDGVCVTGGEPLMQPGLEVFLESVKKLGFLVKLDTNGSFPDRLKHLAAAGLIDYVAMDIKNCPDKYPETTGMSVINLSPVFESVEFLMNGTLPYEFRTTLVHGFHTAASIRELSEWIAGAEKYFLQGFVDSGDNIIPNLRSCSREETEDFLRIARKNVPNTELRGI